MRFHLTVKSTNRKLGGIPVSTSSSDTCPPSCPFRTSGCYAEGGPLAMHWNKVNSTRGYDWSEFIAKVIALPLGQLWRHNQAGDLAGIGEDIDLGMMNDLVMANMGKCGYTYTHKDPAIGSNAKAIEYANANEFIINLSANSLRHADLLVDLGIAPVTVVLPVDSGNTKTPKGRIVKICPAIKHDITCKTCRACSVISRTSIVGFPAHGARKNIVSKIVST